MRTSGVLLIVGVCCLAGSTAGAQDIDPQADRVLRDMSTRLRDAETASVAIAYQLRTTAEGMLQQWNSRFSFALERPDKLVLTLDYGFVGVTIVSDGETAYTHVPGTSNTYIAEEAPANVGAIDMAPLMSTGVHGWTIMAALAADDPYEALTERVDDVRYAGEESLDGLPCHKLAFSMDAIDWTLWVQAGEIPLPVKAALDLTALFEYPGIPNMKSDASIDFTEWRVDADLPADRFTWSPPEDAELVDSLFDDYTFEEEEHALTGAEAPAFKLGLLGGGGMDLADHLGTEIVILDFWATWCGPCVAAMPILIEVADAYKDRGVRFYAINEQEPVETVRRFLEEKKMEVTVALDADGRVGNLYGVNGIPQTVVIGADGIVQVVHIGFLPDLKDTLSGQLDALLAGESLADRKEEVPGYEPEGLATAWTHDAPCRAVATDGPIVYALAGSGRCLVFDEAGDVQRHFRIESHDSTLLVANLLGDEQGELLTFTAWGDAVSAYDTEGTLLWTYGNANGIDDAWPADLDGDGLDEVLIGFNGDAGLHAVDNRGRVLWKYDRIGNVWHVCGGDVTGDGKPEVFSTSSTGQVHVFTGLGDKLLDVDVPVYASMVRVGPDQRVIVSGTGRRGETLLAVGLVGRPHWSIDLPSGVDSITSMHSAPDKPWIAAGMDNGVVQVIDAESGDIIAGVDGQGMQPQVAWLEGESPVLLVATGRVLNAFAVETVEVPWPP